jgi:hypothetical protein
MDRLVHWLETHQMPCFYKHYLGVACPGCGMQSSIILLLKGQFAESIKTYPALLPICFLLGFLIFHIIFKPAFGARVLKYSFIVTVIIINGSYFAHLLNWIK